jgi:hypothetical protein
MYSRCHKRTYLIWFHAKKLKSFGQVFIIFLALKDILPKKRSFEDIPSILSIY